MNRPCDAPCAFYDAAVAAFLRRCAAEDPTATPQQPMRDLSRYIRGIWYFYDETGYLGRIGKNDVLWVAARAELNDVRWKVSDLWDRIDDLEDEVIRVLEAAAPLQERIRVLEEYLEQ